MAAAPLPQVVARRPDPKAFTRLTLVWTLVAMVLFAVLALLGLVLRLSQSNFLPWLPPEWFYAVMTLHSLGMVGLWFAAGMAGVSFLLAPYVGERATGRRLLKAPGLELTVFLRAASSAGRAPGSQSAAGSGPNLRPFRRLDLSTVLAWRHLGHFWFTQRGGAGVAV
jgi:hypothetical protein